MKRKPKEQPKMYRVTFNGTVLEAPTLEAFKAVLKAHFAKENLKLQAAFNAAMADPRRY